jgi:hypothetical protein
MPIGNFCRYSVSIRKRKVWVPASSEQVLIAGIAGHFEDLKAGKTLPGAKDAVYGWTRFKEYTNASNSAATI